MAAWRFQVKVRTGIEFGVGLPVPNLETTGLHVVENLVNHPAHIVLRTTDDKFGTHAVHLSLDVVDELSNLRYNGRIQRLDRIARHNRLESGVLLEILGKFIEHDILGIRLHLVGQIGLDVLVHGGTLGAGYEVVPLPLQEQIIDIYLLLLGGLQRHLLLDERRDHRAGNLGHRYGLLPVQGVAVPIVIKGDFVEHARLFKEFKHWKPIIRGSISVSGCTGKPPCSLPVQPGLHSCTWVQERCPSILQARPSRYLRECN